MTENPLPYVVVTGALSKFFDKIKAAQTPERFTQDFLKKTLGFSGGNYMAFIPFLKRIGFLSTDGVPTEIYHQFRNPSSSQSAVAKAIKHGYAPLFSMNEQAHKLNKADIEGMLIQLTGKEKDSSLVARTLQSFEALKKMANFDNLDEISPSSAIPLNLPQKIEIPANLPSSTQEKVNSNNVDMRLAYTINLNLPETTNIEVFNAIFKSLKEHLLGN